MRDATRRRYLGFAGAGLAGPIAGSLGPGSGDTSADSLPAHFDDRVPELLDRYDVPGASVALVQGGELTWTGAYGEADPEAGRSTTDDTPFRVQSITKSVTAWGVLKLAERGEISLDDSVERHVTSWELPNAEYSWDEVTVRRLLSHSAGLPLLAAGLWWAVGGAIVGHFLPVIADWVGLALLAIALLAVLTVLFPRAGGDEP
ncbi:serine hydrolase domain-containing protein [Halosolutus halophilus]|uniref:serine hydrolase domain-containing protein n=1 Tax=Halosolutus halophilus TaxID=1552990 RepID=UPI002235131B|nr:serine hydrolase domain-containing protein [Halosolutus halophilus]